MNYISAVPLVISVAKLHKKSDQLLNLQRANETDIFGNIPVIWTDMDYGDI